jgi:hypothetical protein
MSCTNGRVGKTRIIDDEKANKNYYSFNFHNI